MIFEISSRISQWGKNSLFNICAGTNGYLHAQNKVVLLPHIIYKINSTWIRDLKLRAKTVKHLGENIRLNLCDFGLDNGFLDIVAKYKYKEKKINWISSELKTFVLQIEPWEK